MTGRILRPSLIALGVAGLAFSVAACTPVTSRQSPQPAIAEANDSVSVDAIARDYVRLTLEIGTHEAGYVDAYYGPEAWQQEAVANPRSLDDLAVAAANLEFALDLAVADDAPPVEARRVKFLKAQLHAARTRLRMIGGEKLSFREESLGLFGATPELKPLAEYDALLASIDELVPGEGTLASRVDTFQNRFVISTNRLKPVFDRAIAACRDKTTRYISLPESERFRMEFVTGKPWSGYNYYQGDFESLIQINTDLPIRISRAVDLGCHEGYPGHHALNMLLEHRLMRDKGWIEYSVYPLYSPQSLIAEGSANYGIELAFPGEERLRFEREVLYPLAGLDPAGAEAYFKLEKALSALQGARFTIAQQYLDGEIDREQAIALTQKYQLASPERARQSIDFTDTYRSYVINYGLGRDMVRDYVESHGQDPLYRWAAMERVISEPTLPVDLTISTIAN